jgi:hypothetical protein
MTNDYLFLMQQRAPLELWRFLSLGYLLTVAIETPILMLRLSPRHSRSRRLVAGIWLTACTYPIVTLVLPLVLTNYSRTVFLIVAETFAPVAECILFWLAFGSREYWRTASMWRDFVAIVVANLASFAVGEVLNVWEWFGLV